MQGTSITTTTLSNPKSASLVHCSAKVDMDGTCEAEEITWHISFALGVDGALRRHTSGCNSARRIISDELR